ncbi:sugar ABC transporter substrate-binding protein [Alicyclobacillaceae bacterium I2511]|nr:sugar ABC transporter substrate-binding protein [Alicyclobacillaceae bacterium I2511]
MKIRKALFSGFVLLTLGTVVTGCGTSTNSTSPSGGSTTAASSSPFVGNSSQTYYMVTFLSGIEYWKGIYAGMEAAAKDLHVQAVYTGAPQYDINQEVTTMEQLIAKKPAGILVSSMNAQAMTPVINQAIAAGIPVISFDSDAPNSQRYAYLGTSNAQAGQIGADYLGKQLGGKGEVAIITTPGELNLDQRVQGFESEIQSKFPGVKVVAVQNGNSSQITSAQVTSALLQTHPHLDGIFAVEADEGTGAATAVKEANRSSVKIVSFDMNTATLDQIKQGLITATIAQGEWSMGFWGLMDAYTVHNNLATPVPNWKQDGVDPVPPSVDTGVTVITKQNVNDYLNLGY